MKDKIDKKWSGCKAGCLNFLDRNKYIRNTLQFLHIRDTRELNRKFRTVYVNQIKPDDYDDKGEELLSYASNEIVTSKYTFWNFIPKNLFEQFRRIANIYFLINIIIIFVTPDPPTSPYTTLAPLVIVVVVTLLKQGYEDILRHNSDRHVNNTPIRILKNNQFVDKKWEDIRCGDIVEVLANQAIPCDLLLLYSETDDNKCFITTANLDGETNLKPRSVMNGIKNIRNPEDLANFRSVIQYEKPNLKLYDFNGKIIVKNKEYPIVNDNVLLRGCNLRVAPLIYAIALYTGKDTKVMRNSKFKSNKLSVIERRLNRFIFVFLIILLILTFLSWGLAFTTNYLYDKHWYLKDREPRFFKSNYSLYLFIALVYFTNLFNYIVPLSMYVTIEMQRFVGSQFIQWDLELYDEKTDTPAKANTSDLNEDLGQIEYLFSDKTGTLTENDMIFKQFSIDGVVYEERGGQLYELNSNIIIDFERNNKIMDIVENLSLCHTVQLDKDGIYQASSPDELSFINFCQKLGIIYKGDETIKQTKEIIRTVEFRGKIRKWEILEILEFDSTRKRMSVILRDRATHRIILYCKGAESFMIKKCISGDFEQTLSTIENFGAQGWRTLALAYKELSEADYTVVKNLLNSAYNDIIDRNTRISMAFDEIESGLALIGSTAVEDKLQENVAETLETIRRAGIKVWVLTGDKKETAINISNSCKHFSSAMEHLDITDLKTRADIEKRLSLFKQQMPSDLGSSSQTRSFALIIDGATLGVLFNENFDQAFREICMKCDAVLCCRMSPAQKAQVVRLVKESKSKPMTCAIGDGANDVSMIQEAHVGLGIYGKEGRNAALSADFAFAKFKFVKRLLLVHGYLYYTRSANLVQYFFYKNLAFVICQFYYAFLNAFSVSSLYDAIVLTMYNIFFTSAPIFLFGLCEQKVAINEIEKNPYLYITIRGNKLLSKREFLKWNSLAIWHSLVAFFFAYGIYFSSTPFTGSGKLAGSTQFGGFVITIIIILVHAKLLLEWQHKNYYLLFGYFLSLLGYLIFILIPNSFILPTFFNPFFDSESTLYWVYFTMFSNGPIWFCLILIVVTAMFPDVIIIVITYLRNENKVKKAKEREAEQMKQAQERNATQSFVRITPRTQSRRDRRLKRGNTNTSIRVFDTPTLRIYNTKVYQTDF